MNEARSRDSAIERGLRRKPGAAEILERRQKKDPQVRVSCAQWFAVDQYSSARMMVITRVVRAGSDGSSEPAQRSSV